VLLYSKFKILIRLQSDGLKTDGSNGFKMDYKLKDNKLEFHRELSELDELVLNFVSILDKTGIKYVIISGYVAILFGRSRTTEDVDIFIEKINSESFGRFFDEAQRSGYWLINGNGKEDAFDTLNEPLSIRMAKKNDAIPNFEIKFPKKDIDLVSLNHSLEVVINGKSIMISPFEVQIPFKIWLGSDKDIEDATHIYELFKEELNKDLMYNISKGLGVDKKMIEYGFE